MATPAEELDVDGVQVRLTNPDKVYFPKLGKDGTKRKLVEYYMAVASGPMMTALRDRPTHLQRFPDGIDGEEIYQKRVPQKHPDYLRLYHLAPAVFILALGARCMRSGSTPASRR